MKYKPKIEEHAIFVQENILVSDPLNNILNKHCCNRKPKNINDNKIVNISTQPRSAAH